jgi:phage terminase large subunit-like protein
MSSSSTSTPNALTSRIRWLLSLDDAARTEAVAALSPRQRRTLAREAWPIVARAEQLEPAGDWFLWLMRPGRGWGKTYAGLQAIRHRLDRGLARTAHVVSRTVHHCADVLVHGTPDAPGLLGLWPVDRKPELQVQKRRLVIWNGAIIRWFGADEPADFQGPQADVGYADEVDRWKPKGMSLIDAFDDFERGIRLGPDPRIFVSSTPRPGKLIAHLLQRDDIYETRGTMMDNRANLNPIYVASQLKRFGGTRRGRQELDGELLDDIQDAVVTVEMLDALRLDATPELVATLVSVDPYGGGADACGIVGLGRGLDEHGYILSDRTMQGSSHAWATKAVDLALDLEAPRVLVETDYGAELAARPIRDEIKRRGLHLVVICRTSGGKSKATRFNAMTAPMFERGELHPVGSFPDLEDECRLFTPYSFEGSESPNRADALAHGVNELFPLGTIHTAEDLMAVWESEGRA